MQPTNFVKQVQLSIDENRRRSSSPILWTNPHSFETIQFSHGWVTIEAIMDESWTGTTSLNHGCTMCDDVTFEVFECHRKMPLEFSGKLVAGPAFCSSKCLCLVRWCPQKQILLVKCKAQLTQFGSTTDPPHTIWLRADHAANCHQTISDQMMNHNSLGHHRAMPGSPLFMRVTTSPCPVRIASMITRHRLTPPQRCTDHCMDGNPPCHGCLRKCHHWCYLVITTRDLRATAIMAIANWESSSQKLKPPRSRAREVFHL